MSIKVELLGVQAAVGIAGKLNLKNVIFKGDRKPIMDSLSQGTKVSTVEVNSNFFIFGLCGLLVSQMFWLIPLVLGRLVKAGMGRYFFEDALPFVRSLFLIFSGQA